MAGTLDVHFPTISRQSVRVQYWYALGSRGVHVHVIPCVLYTDRLLCLGDRLHLGYSRRYGGGAGFLGSGMFFSLSLLGISAGSEFMGIPGRYLEVSSSDRIVSPSCTCETID